MLNKIKSALPIGLTLLGVFSAIFLVTKFTSDKDNTITSATVMVRSLSGGGGSGVIVTHSESESTVLTNNHVCEVIKDGGTVQLNNGQNYLISRYSPSKLHDVCLLYIQTDLGASVNLSKNAPDMFTKAIISGHPNLLPNVITRGHFSQSEIIQVFMGVRSCNDDERMDEELGQLCLFFGGMPVLKSFDAVLVTATIMPGSSGSAVYNSNNEVSGLVFAGSGELSYAYTVPYSYVYNFYYNEPRNSITINYELDLKKALQAQSKRSAYYSHIIDKCSDKSVTNTVIIKYCEVLVKDMKFRGKLWK